MDLFKNRGFASRALNVRGDFDEDLYRVPSAMASLPLGTRTLTTKTGSKQSVYVRG
jgi:hypothetical protein